MSIGSDIRDEFGQPNYSSARPAASISGDAISPLLATVDAFFILLSSTAGGIGYQWLAGYPISSILPYFAVGLFAGFIHIFRMNRSGYYDFPDSAKPRVEIVEVLVCWLTTGLLLAFFALLLKVGLDYSRGAFVLFYAITPIGLLGARKFTKTALAAAVSHGVVGRHDAVLVGEFNELAALRPQVLLDLFGSAEVDRFVLSREDDHSARAAADARIIDSVASFVRRHNCREILLALSWSDDCRLDFIRDRVKAIPVAVKLLPDVRVRSLTNLSASALPRVLAIEVQRAPLGKAQRLVKRAMDIVFASLALIFFLPIMTLTAIAIRLDSPGPVIFRQNRKGFNGTQFVIFKFRTMAVQENGPTIVQATRSDARVTAIGRLLRSTSIDELPQLFNVLKGDMSLIGPRPHALAHDNYFESVLSDYAFRHHVKPGITGWAQCNGARGATPSIEHIAERVKLDLWYINNWSFWLDIHIIIKTCFEVLRKRNAY